MTGRLIDADALKQKIAQGIGNDQGGNLPPFNLGYDEGLVDALGTIDDMPAVKAIPVEWLKDQIEIASSNGEDDYANAIEWTVMKWQIDAEEKEE